MTITSIENTLSTDYPQYTIQYDPNLSQPEIFTCISLDDKNQLCLSIDDNTLAITWNEFKMSEANRVMQEIVDSQKDFTSLILKAKIYNDVLEEV